MSIFHPWSAPSAPDNSVEERHISIEGLWIITFIRSSGGGLVNGTSVFQDGLILGGDNERCYIGDYQETDVSIEGKIDLPGHTRIKEPSLFFGKAEEPVVCFSLERQQEGKFPYIGTGEIQNPVDVYAHFTIALQLAYRLD